MHDRAAAAIILAAVSVVAAEGVAAPCVFAPACTCCTARVFVPSGVGAAGGVAAMVPEIQRTSQQK